MARCWQLIKPINNKYDEHYHTKAESDKKE